MATFAREQKFSFYAYCTRIYKSVKGALVREGGIEPPTSKLSVWRSTTELLAHSFRNQDSVLWLNHKPYQEDIKFHKLAGFCKASCFYTLL